MDDLPFDTIADALQSEFVDLVCRWVKHHIGGGQQSLHLEERFVRNHSTVVRFQIVHDQLEYYRMESDEYASV